MADKWEGKTPDGISWRYKLNRNGERAKGANGRPVKVYGWRTTIDGKEVRVKPSEDLEAVRAERDRIRTTRREGTYVDRRKGQILFKDYAAKWLTSKTDVDPDSSIRTYKSRLNATINPLIGEKKLTELAPDVLQDFVNDLQRQGKHPTLYFNTVAAILRDAINKDVIVRKDPKVGVIVPPRKPREPKSLTKREYAETEKALSSNTKLRTIFTVLGETGARLSEGLALCEDQINEQTGEMVIDRQVAKHHVTKETYLKEPKSRSGIRRVLMSPDLARALKEWIKENPPTDTVIRFRYRDGHEEMRAVRLIFTTDAGRPMVRDSLKSLWKSACKAAGIAVNPHQLRHSLATLLIGERVDVKTVQSILGHSRASTTLDMYTDPTDEGRESALQALSRRRLKAV
ncbi:tyrosine-type recombinase/integrase [Spirillospora sp. CA-253888]